MENLNFVGKYKEKIIKLILNSDIIVKLINPKSHNYLDLVDILLGGTFFIDKKGHIVKKGQGEKLEIQGHIFDHIFIDGAINNAKVFINIEVYVDKVQYDILNEFTLLLNIFAEKTLISLDENSIPTKSEMKSLGLYGNRIDQLCSCIDGLLNKNSSFGIGDVQPATIGYNQIYYPNNNYYGKTLRYTVKNYNDIGDNCGN